MTSGSALSGGPVSSASPARRMMTPHQWNASWSCVASASRASSSRSNAARSPVSSRSMTCQRWPQADTSWSPSRSPRPTSSAAEGESLGKRRRLEPRAVTGPQGVGERRRVADGSGDGDTAASAMCVAALGFAAVDERHREAGSEHGDRPSGCRAGPAMACCISDSSSGSPSRVSSGGPASPERAGGELFGRRCWWRRAGRRPRSCVGPPVPCRSGVGPSPGPGGARTSSCRRAAGTSSCSIHRCNSEGPQHRVVPGDATARSTDGLIDNVGAWLRMSCSSAPSCGVGSRPS